MILCEGRVRDAVLATIALPSIFTPFRADGMELVDGGIFDPVPVSIARSLVPHLPVVGQHGRSHRRTGARAFFSFADP